MTFVQRHAYGFGCRLAAMFWPFFRRRRRISVENLMRCGVAVDEESARRIAKQAFCHFMGHMCEALCVPGVVNAGNWREHLEPEFDWDQSTDVHYDRKDLELEESWWYDEK